MDYILKQFDEPLVKFSATTDTSEPEIQILWTNEEKAAFLPLDLTLTPDGLSRWLRRRTIPKNRAYVHSLLAKCGLNINRPLGIISVCKGLSLNDCYWVVEDGDTASFGKVNLYDTPFSNVLAELAFTGYGRGVGASLVSSPEFTTNGMLRKCWRRMGGKVYLYKGGTEGAANTGNEPYSEFYAAQIAAAMGVHAIPYGLSRWKGVLCSTCELFTDKAYAYLPIGHLVSKGGMGAVRAYYEMISAVKLSDLCGQSVRRRAAYSMGDKFVNTLNGMLVFDAVICNVDRHFGNFGVMVDNRTNTIVSPASLFDHGNSLFNFAGADAWTNETALEEYIETLYPSVYDDFLGTAKAVLTPELREKLRHLLNFKFKKHSRYNLPEKRLRMMERQVQKRARILLDM